MRRHLNWVLLEEAHEIINTATVMTDPEEALPTYKSAGSNPVPDDVWPTYTPPPPYTKNTTRLLQFNESEFIASPGFPGSTLTAQQYSYPCGTQTIITTSDGYTWGAMSTAINAMWPYNPAQYSGLAAENAYYAGNLITTPPPRGSQGDSQLQGPEHQILGE